MFYSSIYFFFICQTFRRNEFNTFDLYSYIISYRFLFFFFLLYFLSVSA